MATLNFPIFFANRVLDTFLFRNQEGFYSCIIMGVQELRHYGKHQILEILNQIKRTDNTDVLLN